MCTLLSLLDAGLVSKMLELIAWLELRILFAFQHRVHHGLECASCSAECFGRQEYGAAISGEFQRSHRFSFVFLAPEIVVNHCKATTIRLEKIGRSTRYRKKDDEVVEVFGIGQRASMASHSAMSLPRS